MGNHLSLNVNYAPGDTVTIYGCGTLSVVMRYQDQQGNLLPAPPNGYFALSCLANWNNGDISATIANDTADDSLKDPYHQQTAGNPSFPFITGGASGVMPHLIQANSTNIYSYDFTPSMYVKCSNSWIGGSIQCNAGAGIVPDTRSVTIACAPIEDGGNFHKGANDLPVANVRNSDGSMTVDTIPTSLDTVAKTWEFQQWLEAQTTGFDVETKDNWLNLVNTQVDWMPSDSLGSSTSDNSGTLGTFAQLPATYNVHVKVSDKRPNLSATAENDYTIHIHSPFENSIWLGAVFDHVQPYDWTEQIVGGGSVSVNMEVKKAKEWSLMGQSFNNLGGAFLGGVCGSGLVAIFAPDCPPAAAAIADMVFNIFGYAVTNAGTPEPTAMKAVDGNYAAFTTAIAEQQAILANWTNPNINDIVDCPGDPRIVCLDSLNAIAAAPNDYWNYCVPKGRCHGGGRYNQNMVTGNAYGVNGYIGKQTNYPVLLNDYIKNVWEWTLGSLGPNH